MRAPVHPVNLPSAGGPTAYGSAVPILIVDDNAGKRLALGSMLVPLGHEITEADSGPAALRCLMSRDFAVILMDVRMPVMDGFETADLIRQRRQSELTPIIFISAYGSESMANITAYAAGAADFIFSPVPPAELRAKVTVFANLYLRAERLAADAQDLRNSADRLTLLTDAAPIGIFRTDAENNFVYTNPRWSEITGISFEDAVGRPWAIVSPDRAARFPAVAQVGDGDDHRLMDRFEIFSPGDSLVRVVEWTAEPIEDADGGMLGWVGTLADVSAGAAASAAMEAARDAALAASRMQRDFAATASHELKTPTASVLGFVEEVLDHDSLSEIDRKYLGIAYRSAQRLSRLIDDLLLLGAADVVPAETTYDPTELMPLVRLAMSSFSGAAQDGNVHLAIETGVERAAERLWALADPLRLEQALANLISNALKFTPPGGEVRVAVRGGEDAVQIEVSDTGIGIEESALDDIFNRFYRTRAALDAGVSGFGLGLAIAQRMIEAQRGRLSVTSVVGQGSTFTITLPAAPRLLPA